jgi:peptidoglycan biosynthesis protein MviN/MurJ (putative lipid II flippase)
MYVSGAELVLNIVLSLVLMRYFGLAGISFATVLAFMISKLYLLWVIWKKNGIHPSHYLDLKYYAMYTLALYLAFGLSLYLFSGQ